MVLIIAAAQAAKGAVSDASHGGKHHRTGQFIRANFKGNCLLHPPILPSERLYAYSTAVNDLQKPVQVSTFRAKVLHFLEPVMDALSRVPAMIMLGIYAVLLISGAYFKGVWGAISFGLIAIFLAVLLYVSWPGLRPVERLMRFGVLWFVAAITIVFLFQR